MAVLSKYEQALLVVQRNVPKFPPVARRIRDGCQTAGPTSRTGYLWPLTLFSLPSLPDNNNIVRLLDILSLDLYFYEFLYANEPKILEVSVRRSGAPLQRAEDL